MENANFEKIIKDEIEIQEVGQDVEILFDINSLEDSTFKKMLKYLSSITMSPDEFILLSLLVALAGSIPKSVYFRLSKNLNLRLNLWGLIIGTSTLTKKSSSIAMTLHELYRIQKNLFEIYQDKKSAYEKLSEDQKKDIPKPKLERIIFPADLTAEALIKMLSENERGFLAAGEFGSVLNSLEKSYNKDLKPLLTNIYDCPALIEVARLTRENISVENPYLSLLGASTITWIRNNISVSDLESGFFSRFLFAIVNKNRKGFVSLLNLNSLTYNSPDYFDIRSVYDFTTSISGEHILEIDEEASKLYKYYEKEKYFELMKLAGTSKDLELSFRGRLIVSTLKIAGILSVIEQRFVITKNEMLNAIKISEYFEKNISKLLEDELTEKSEFQLKEEKIFKIIKESKQIKRSELLRKKIVGSSKEFDVIIQNLTEKELVEVVTNYNQQNRKQTIFYRAKEEQ